MIPFAFRPFSDFRYFFNPYPLQFKWRLTGARARPSVRSQSGSLSSPKAAAGVPGSRDDVLGCQGSAVVQHAALLSFLSHEPSRLEKRAKRHSESVNIDLSLSARVARS